LQAGWLFALLLYLLLALWQLGLPGLHYDEAREAGQNAMELLTHAPVAAYRDAALEIGGIRLPLMVQEYIGALNVYLALPFLGISGIGVPNLRLVGVLAGLAALLLLERAVTTWMAGRPQVEATGDRARLPLSAAGVAAMLLLAASPSFIFWSRQGVFVTNLTQPLVLWMIWQALRWRQTGTAGALRWAALAGGLALYAKLLAIWVVLPFAVALAVEWLATRRKPGRPQITVALALQTAGLFLLPLLPLLLFNLQTGGSLMGLGAQMGTSYYGVDNTDWLGNLGIRLPQVVSTLRGDHLWYLGTVAANNAAPWLAAAALVAGLAIDWRRALPPLLLVLAAMLLSLVTPSALWITHYALLLPLLVGAVAESGALAAGWGWAQGGWQRWAAGIAVAAGLATWVVAGVLASGTYHSALARSGGLADHSDATYTLAAYLRGNGYGAPIALDWGLDAGVRFLSEGAVTPIEIFGYDSPAAPDVAFGARVASFMARDDAVFLLRAPGQEVFAGRRAIFEQEAAALGKEPVLLQVFSQRDGTPLFELWGLGPSRTSGRPVDAAGERV
jgi:hypothetical protein